MPLEYSFKMPNNRQKNAKNIGIPSRIGSDTNPTSIINERKVKAKRNIGLTDFSLPQIRNL